MSGRHPRRHQCARGTGTGLVGDSDHFELGPTSTDRPPIMYIMKSPPHSYPSFLRIDLDPVPSVAPPGLDRFLYVCTDFTLLLVVPALSECSIWIWIMDGLFPH